MTDIVELLRHPGNDVTRDDAIAEILRLRAVLEELAVGFDRACNASHHMAEAQRLNKCAEFCRTSQLPRPNSNTPEKSNG